MLKPKRIRLACLALGGVLLLAGCGDETNKDLAKVAVIGAGAGSGALLGTMVTPQNKMLGGVLGGVAGGVLGSFVGGKLVK